MDHHAEMKRDWLVLGWREKDPLLTEKQVHAAWEKWMESVTIPDGIYIRHADGSDWDAIEISRGKPIRSTCGANMGTHRASGDVWSSLDPEDATEEVAVDVQAALGHGEEYPEMVAYLRVPDEQVAD